MSNKGNNKYFRLEIMRATTGEGFEVYSQGGRLEENKEQQIIAILQEAIENTLSINNDVAQRRSFIAANDLYKGKLGYMGSSKLASKFGVSAGSISVDRKVILEKGIQPDPEVVKQLEELNAPPEPVKEPGPEAPDTTKEAAQEPEKTGKKNGKGKGKRGKK